MPVSPGSAPVLLTDGDERSTLAAARALVRAGHRVHVAGHRRWTLAGVSREVVPERLATHPLDDPAAYVGQLADVVRERGIRLLLPVTDPSMEAVLEHRALLPPYLVLPVPTLEAFRAASDKVGLLQRACAAGLAVPESVIVATPTSPVSFEAIGFPAIVKPHRSVVQGGEGGRRRKCPVAFVESEAACREALTALPPEAFPVMVQRRVRGPGEGIFLLRWEGRIVARFAHRRLREKPPAGGVSVYRESIVVERDLMAAAERLLNDLEWRGVAMIECKRDLTTGRPVLMEINGRWWGSLQLAVDAGVDFPRLVADIALGGTIPPFPPSYRPGVRCRWFWGDVDHLLLRLFRSQRALHLGDDAPSRLTVLRDFFRWATAHDRWEIERRGDRAPFLLETMRRGLSII